MSLSKYSLIFILILLFFVFAKTLRVSAQDQNLQFEHLTIDNGLSANTIFCFLQDSRGFLWIGTYNGLNRYDGYNFKIFRSSKTDLNTLSDSKIRTLAEDKDGNLWIGTMEGGLNKFNIYTERFTRFQYEPNNPNSISSEHITSLCFEKSGNLWIGTELNGLDYFNMVTSTVYHYQSNSEDVNSLSSNRIKNLYIDENEVLWVGTGKGLNKFKKDENRFIRFKKSDGSGIGGDIINSIHQDSNSNLWIATEDGGLSKYDTKSEEFTIYKHNPRTPTSISENHVSSLIIDSKNTIWLGTQNSGINIFDPVTNKFTNCKKNNSVSNSISDNDVFTIYEDRSGIIWLGTWSTGINKFDKTKKKFQTLRNDPNSTNSIGSNTVYAIHEDSHGFLWVGTAGGGVDKIDMTNNSYIHYRYNPDNTNSISSNNVYSICEDKDGNVWVATFDAGINKYNRKANNFKRYQHINNDDTSLGSNTVSLVFCDSYGNLWIGLKDGLDRLKRGQDEFTHYKHKSSNPKSIKQSLIYSLYEDRARNLWIGTYGSGLMKYNRISDDFTFFEHNAENQNSISSNIIPTICEDENGNLWLGTDDAGLDKFDFVNNRVKNFTEESGLPSINVAGILSDNSGNLWISTGNGISKFNIESETFLNFNKKDGLQGNDFNTWAYFKSSDGTMYFGGPEGINFFNPGSLGKNSYVPPIVITEFQILHKPVSIGFDTLLGRVVLEKSITVTEILELAHDENIISFEIAALDFHSPEKNQYTYFLEGFDKHWIQTDALHREITYTNLDPDEYVLRVKGSNNDGIWNEAGLSLKIIVNPPWWSTWWAYILYGIFITLIFAGSTKFYLNREKLRTQLQLEHDHAKKLEEVDKLKSNFYANISHEFRTPLMLILGPLEKLVRKLHDEESKKQAGLIRGNANRLLNLINQLLDLSRLEAKKLKLNASRGNIAQFIKRLAKEFQSLADQRDLTLSIIIEKDTIEAYFDKEKMEKIITNVMSNAIKFTPRGGRITVKLVETDHNEIEITVRDSGIGIPHDEVKKIFDRFYQVDSSHTREHEGTGIGLALTKEFVELHRGQILVDSVEDHWTEVKICLPLGSNHLNEDEIVDPVEFQVRDIDSVTDLISNEFNADEIERENLIDKTIVLVVEDNPDLREYIRDDLKDLYYVVEAANGEQGLRKAEKLIPDLVVSDIMMPIMDGYELTKKLREDEKTSHIPIILLTAKSDKESKLEGLGIGADDYLTKPFDSQELLARIKNLIETRRLLQEKFGSGSVIVHKKEKEKLSVLDQQFLDRVMSVIDQHISEEEFSIEEFGRDVGMSRSQMHRKLKALTGKSASLYLRTVRLAKAKQLIEERKASISEISYQVGFSSPAYFSRCFKEEFGYTPSEAK